jgi:hypothetical protein
MIFEKGEEYFLKNLDSIDTPSNEVKCDILYPVQDYKLSVSLLE